MSRLRASLDSLHFSYLEEKNFLCVPTGEKGIVAGGFEGLP
jgi:hypothetical protein